MLHTLLISTLAVSHVTNQTGTAIVDLSSLHLDAMSSGWNSPRKNRSADNNGLKIAGRAFANGVGTHAVSDCTVQLNKTAEKFTALVGVDDEVGQKGSIVFRVYVDGKKKAETKVMHGGEAAVPIEVNLKGAKYLRLQVDDGGDGIDFDHADWANAQITYAAGSKTPVLITSAQEPTMKIAHIDRVKTAINGPRIVGATPGRPFLFMVPASGQRPLTYKAHGLPAGLGIDVNRGIISGSLKTDGKWTVLLEVSGPKGVAKRTLTIVGGKDKLALTPPMGWNSWNVWAGAIDQKKVEAAANSFISTGLADFGYSYVNIDDCWEAGRAPNGRILTNSKFPDMLALSTYVHSKGLKLGIYSSPGPQTCAGFTGSYQHELDDAKQYGEWGIDYLKHDWCSYGQIEPNPTLFGLKKPYILMHESLEQSGRDIVFSLCQYGIGDVFNWGRSVGGNLWRTTGDITDTWQSMSSIGFSHSPKAKGAGPGGWNDPDMLVVGKLGWGANPRQTKLSGNEQITHITLWSLLAAPLIIGCDLTQIDQFTQDLLMNPEMCDVDQDQLGKAAKRLTVEGDVEVWGRPLFDGSYAVGLFNRGPAKGLVKVKWSDLGLMPRGDYKVRDLWQRKDLGRKQGGYSATVPGHGAVFIKVSQ